jgi:MFS family permease
MIAPPGSARGLVPVALALSTAFLMEALDSTILIAAIPAIAADFEVAPLRVNLAVSIYLMTVAAIIPASGWFADRFGARRVYLAAVLGFMLAGIAAALAPGLKSLIAMRILQGLAGGLMIPVGRLLLIRVAPRQELACDHLDVDAGADRSGRRAASGRIAGDPCVLALDLRGQYPDRADRSRDCRAPVAPGRRRAGAGH